MLLSKNTACPQALWLEADPMGLHNEGRFGRNCLGGTLSGK
jgi:hypothetical protein